VYSPIELIVVDNYSSDQTPEISKEYNTRFFLKGPERSSQRNLGARNARGDFLFFVDSDMELSPDTTDVCVRKIMAGYDALILPEKTISTTYWTKVLAFERMTYVGDPLYEAARFFNKEVFESFGGYDEEITGTEDCELQARIEKRGYRIAHANVFILHHEEERSLKDYIKKRYYYVKSGKRYLRKHPQRALRQFVPIKRSHLKHWKLFLRNPLYTLGLIMFRICDAIVFLAGILSR
jgi:glycosyltransferase involved in cell wall biosynthesis